MQQVGVVLVIFSDNFKRHLTQKLLEKDIAVQAHAEAELYDPLIQKLMSDLVPRLVE